MNIELGSVAGMEDFFLYVVEDFVPDTYFKFMVPRVMYAPKYSYISNSAYFGGTTVVPESEWSKEHVSDLGQFVFSVVSFGTVTDSEIFSFLEPMLFKMYDTFPAFNFNGVSRAKFNILTARPERAAHLHNIPHVDLDTATNTAPVYTAILYLDGEDGDTVFFKERFDPALPRPEKFTEFTRLSFKPNTLVFFNSAYYHASSTPRSGGARCVLNLVFDATRK